MIDPDESLSAKLISAFAATRARSEQIFALVREGPGYDQRPISLRHPIRFYDGHLDAFNFNTLCLGVLGQRSFAPALDQLFGRGIDPENEAAAQIGSVTLWPPRDEVRAYKEEVGRRLQAALCEPGMFSGSRHPHLRRGKLFFLLLEHELMHQETLLYLLHQLPHDWKRPPAGVPRESLDGGPDGTSGPSEQAEVPAGTAVLGADEDEFDFGWDNEFPRHEVPVPRFSIDVHNVTNGQFLDFVAAGGYSRRELWDATAWAFFNERGLTHPAFWKKDREDWLLRGLFSDRALPLSFPVQVTHAEARAYARFVHQRLPTEPEWHRAAHGDDGRRYPWGEAPPDATRGTFDFVRWSCTRVGATPAGASPFGVHDLVGNGWEWTDTVFGPFPGFAPFSSYPGYSADFFDGKHRVLKGGSCFTDGRLLRRSFRNWFFWHYPFLYATFRCVSS